MKKIFTFLAILLSLSSLDATAQITCNPAFTFVFVNNTTVKFTPVNLNDSAYTQHVWTFGDGSLASNQYSPTHTYASSGVFTVKHKKTYITPNGIFACADSTTQVITIGNTACNLAANYYHTTSTTNALAHSYFNTSVNFVSGDSIRWNFGDGTVSYLTNPTHTFATPGIYNVCLRVKKNSTSPTTLPCISEYCRLDTVSASTPCNLQAYFYIDSLPPNIYHFVNMSVGSNAGDSLTWTFGDGGISHDANPNHTYANPGIYAVCLTIVKPNTAGSAPCYSQYCQTVIYNPACALVASFTSYRDSLSTALNSYHFTNTSASFTASDSIRWTFGDGTSSNQINPIHNYTSIGTFNVCLRIIKRNANGTLSNCISEVCHSITVTAQNLCNVQAYFTNVTDSAIFNLVHFTNISPGFSPADSITWTFGDGTTSHDINPNHTFANAGVYNVCVTITRPTIPGAAPCVRTFCKTVTIVSPCTLVANFTWYHDSTGISLNAYHFTNTSTPFNANDSIRWTFGDGTSSNQINPTHTYAQPGNYVVCLRIIKRTASGTLSNCVAEKCNTVTVPLQCNITAAYSYIAATANYKTLVFTNTTAVAGTSYTAFWTFGDGTSATGWNTTHTYANAGTYTVCLTVQAGNCTNTKCSTVTITAPAPPCSQLANYTFVRSVSNNNIVTFTPDYIDPTVQYTWTFGDGTGAITSTSTHTFAAIGYYTVCLTAYKNNSCASTVCKSVYVSSTANCSLNNVWFTVNPDSLVPNRITFLAQSPTVIISQQWTITKLPVAGANGVATINGNNPTYVFLDSGIYRVCLRATFAAGCVKEYCTDIHVAQNMPFATSCSLQAFPNPATNVVNASVTLAAPTTLYAYIYNSLNMVVGQKQQQGFVGANTVSINIANLPAGIYVYRLVHGNDVCATTFVKL